MIRKIHKKILLVVSILALSVFALSCDGQSPQAFNRMARQPVKDASLISEDASSSISALSELPAESSSVSSEFSTVESSSSEEDTSTSSETPETSLSPALSVVTEVTLVNGDTIVFTSDNEFTVLDSASNITSSGILDSAGKLSASGNVKIRLNNSDTAMLYSIVCVNGALTFEGDGNMHIEHNVPAIAEYAIYCNNSALNLNGSGKISVSHAAANRSAILVSNGKNLTMTNANLEVSGNTGGAQDLVDLSSGSSGAFLSATGSTITVNNSNPSSTSIDAFGAFMLNNTKITVVGGQRGMSSFYSGQCRFENGTEIDITLTGSSTTSALNFFGSLNMSDSAIKIRATSNNGMYVQQDGRGTSTFTNSSIDVESGGSALTFYYSKSVINDCTLNLTGYTRGLYLSNTSQFTLTNSNLNAKSTHPSNTSSTAAGVGSANAIIVDKSTINAESISGIGIAFSFTGSSVTIRNNSTIISGHSNTTAYDGMRVTNLKLEGDSKIISFGQRYGLMVYTTFSLADSIIEATSLSKNLSFVTERVGLSFINTTSNIIQSGTIIATGNRVGIQVDKLLQVTGGSVYGISEGTGIYAQDLSVNGVGAILEGKSTGQGLGVETSQAITVTGGSLVGTGDNGGIKAGTNITVNGAGSLTGTCTLAGTGGTGVKAVAVISVSGGTLQGESYDFGPGFGAIYSDSNSITANNASNINETYRAVQQVGTEYKIPLGGIRTITNYTNYTWSFSSGSLDFSPDGTSGARAGNASDGIADGTAERIDGSDIVTLQGSSTHSIKFPINIVPGTYVLSFDLNGGESDPIPQQQLKKGQKASVVHPPRRAGFSFAGWNKQQDGSGAQWDFETDKMPAEDVVLYAQWSVGKYTVTFDSMGGTAIEPAIVAAGSIVPKPDDPSRTNYTFSGWFSAPSLNLESRWDFETDKMPAEDVVLYAQWSVGKYTVTFDSMGGTAIEPAFVAAGSIVPKPDDPSRTNYTFSGWFSTPGLNLESRWDFETDLMPSRALVLYAKWVLIPGANVYPVIFDSTGGTLVAQTVAAAGEFIAQPAKPERAGHVFDGWFISPIQSGVSPWDFARDKMPSHTLYLYARWVPLRYVVNFHSLAPGPIATKSVTYNFGALLQRIGSQEFTNAENLYIEGWYTSPEFDASTLWIFATDTMPAGQLDLYAKWASYTQQLYKVTFVSEANNDKVTKEALYPQNSLITRIPDFDFGAHDGYSIEAWYTTPDFESASRWDFKLNRMPQKDITLYAKWQPRLNTVTFVFYFEGAQKTIQETYAYRSLISEPAQAFFPIASGYSIEGWYTSSAFESDSRWNFEQDNMPDHSIVLFAKVTKSANPGIRNNSIWCCIIIIILMILLCILLCLYIRMQQKYKKLLQAGNVDEAKIKPKRAPLLGNAALHIK